MKTSVSKAGLAFVCGAFLMTLGVPAESGKPTKPGPTTPDPCENMNQPGAFPGYAFTRPVGQRVASWGIFLADEAGKCERLLYTYSGAEGGVVGKTLDMWVAGQTGLILGERRGFAIEALSFSISFDAKGIPTVTTAGYGDILAPADLPPSTLAPADWQTTYLFNPKVSSDGARILFSAYDQTLGARLTWVCAFDSGLGSDSVSGCRSVRYDDDDESVAPSWGIDSQTVYYTDRAGGGFGNSVYRMTLTTDWETGQAAPPVAEVWTRGTLFREVRVSQATGNELLAVSEVSPAGNGCNRVYVVDVGSCASGGCSDTNILNGAGHPARWGGWLPSGRLIAEGQSAPSRKNVCTATNRVVTFQHDDLTETVTVQGDGYQPDGAGSG